MASPELTERDFEGTPIYDACDVDLVVKVLSNTAFSPFFICLIPTFYIFQGAKLDDPIVISSALYVCAVCLFRFLKWYSRIYENQGSVIYRPPRLDWSEQIVVITGGSSGIGELLANTLAVKNVTVVVLDVKPIQTENYNITYYECDVSKWEDVERVSKRVVEELGQPTILVNNAGVVQGKRILDLSPEDVNQTFGVNTLAHFWTLKAFLPGMIEAKTGHIVTTSSILGIAGCAQMTDYSASKAALIRLHESLRFELDNLYNCPQIRTTLLIPGHIFTPMFSHVAFQDSVLQRFFLPSVQPVTVVKRVVEALDDQHSQVLFLPFYANFMPYMQHFPSYIREFCQWITQADYAMQNFTKVSGLRKDELIQETKN